MRKPVTLSPASADTTIPLSEEQRRVYTTLEPHYKKQVERHPECRWLRSHYGFIVGALRKGVVGSLEAEDTNSD
jgi:hypothetical protein